MKNKERFDLRKMWINTDLTDGMVEVYNGKDLIIQLERNDRNSTEVFLEWLESDALVKKNHYHNHPLIKAIHDADMTITKFCDETFINKSTLYSICRGTHTPSEYTLRQIAKGLKMDVDEVRELCD